MVCPLVGQEDKRLPHIFNNLWTHIKMVRCLTITKCKTWHSLDLQDSLFLPLCKCTNDCNFRPLDYSKPISIKCPCCSMQVMTTINQEPGNTAYLWSAVICCCIGVCFTCLPFLTNKCMDKNHYCPSCGFNIIRKHRGFIDCDW